MYSFIRYTLSVEYVDNRKHSYRTFLSQSPALTYHFYTAKTGIGLLLCVLFFYHFCEYSKARFVPRFVAGFSNQTEVIDRPNLNMLK